MRLHNFFKWLIVYVRYNIVNIIARNIVLKLSFIIKSYCHNISILL